ncbi:NAD(P)H-quinone oxidoreductase subunit 5 [Tamilnaduibacter salinus]|uniref:Probable inorganic carbon transporter subunit DabB n=1 Tax=Tamilnaduibacter salinus TaxID=1484056 RepID=A0A2U1CTQ6_9GAMM|nr:NADH-quinone oxidoreductase subunit L [Tamilnaduibacter salinus]PVY70084.1 NAD(P)H-quinone oxidoreductase subunit 5 [Tamilnaduibacter salinus]
MVGFQAIESLFSLLVPLLFATGAVASGLATNQRQRLARSLTFKLAFVFAVAAAVGSGWWSVDGVWFNHTPLASIMLLLITLLGMVLGRFSERYLAGDPGQRRFMIWLQVILASVAMIAITNHLLVFLVSWIAISVSLHQLLMFFPDRPRAALAAHKKFIFARIAELCLGLAFLLLYVQYDTPFIDRILAQVSASTGVPVGSQIAAGLMAVAALLKCAQVPFHGWLIQVVESPTPVSALLHAGVVNLGGFLMILMAPLISEVNAAQWLLLAVAGPTAVFASLVMMTRISIKVRLAWSTCSQMGWMLVECALGLYELALLHLVAHSAYKAHSFLNAGNTVELSIKKRLVAINEPGPRHWLSAAVLSGLFMLPTVLLSNETAMAHVFSWVVPGIALTILLSEFLSAAGGVLTVARGLIIGTVFWALYWFQKTFFSMVLAPPESQASLLEVVFVAALIALLVRGYYQIRYHRSSPAGARLYRFLFAAGYLDEWSTRLTLKIWPAQLPDVVRPRAVVSVSSTSGSREST